MNMKVENIKKNLHDQEREERRKNSKKEKNKHTKK